MIDLESTRRYSSWGRALVNISGGCSPIIAAFVDWAKSIDKTEHPVLFQHLIFITQNAVWFYVALLFIFIVGLILARTGDHLTWTTLQACINSLKQIAFNENDGDINDDHRVTLFKYRKWCWRRIASAPFIMVIKKGWWPWSGWLEPYLRSGHTGKNTKTVFWVPDRGAHSEGLAGLCWVSGANATVWEPGLPKIIETSSDANVEKYSKRTKMPEWMIRKYVAEGRPLARNILVYPVLTSSGNRWGVMVFDSQGENGIEQTRVDTAFRTMIEPMGVLLEGV